MASSMESLHRTIPTSLLCKICADLLEEPKILDCRHTFCLPCLKTMFKGKMYSISCPICEQSTVIHCGKVETLSTNDAIKSMVDNVKTPRKLCANCPSSGGKRAATAHCQVCHLYLCDGCRETHDSWRQFSEHEIITMEDIRQGRAVPRMKIVCQEHGPEERENICTDVCVTCRKVVCMRCLPVHENKNHDVTSLSQYEKKIQDECSKLLHAADAKIASLELIERSDELMKSVENAFELSYQRLINHQKTLRRKLYSYRKEALQKFPKDFPKDDVHRIVNARELIATVAKAPQLGQDIDLHRSLLERAQEMLGSGSKLSSTVTDAWRDVNMPVFKTSTYQNTGIVNLGEIIVMELIPIADVKLPTINFMDVLAPVHDGTMAVGSDIGGMAIYSADGMLQRTVLKDVKIFGLGFLSDGRCVLSGDDNVMGLYTPEYMKLHVKFETLRKDEGGVSDLTVDRDNHIYVGYRKARKIQVFTPAGGKAVKEIPCGGYEPSTIYVVEPSKMLVVMTHLNAISVIDESGTERHELVKGPEDDTYHAVCRDGTILVACINKQRDEVSIEQYTSELEYVTTLIIDYKIEKSERNWCYLQEFLTGEVALCTSDMLYIFRRSSSTVSV